MDIRQRIRAKGKPTGKIDAECHPVYEVSCQGCRKGIRSDSDLRKVGYLKTKSGNELFFHTDCMGDVWKHGIV